MRNLSVMGMGMGKSLKLRYANVRLEFRPGYLWGNCSIRNLPRVITAGNNLFVFNNRCSPTISTQSSYCEDKISVVSKLFYN